MGSVNMGPSSGVATREAEERDIEMARGPLQESSSLIESGCPKIVHSAFTNWSRVRDFLSFASFNNCSSMVYRADTGLPEITLGISRFWNHLFLKLAEFLGKFFIHSVSYSSC